MEFVPTIRKKEHFQFDIAFHRSCRTFKMHYPVKLMIKLLMKSMNLQKMVFWNVSSYFLKAMLYC